MNHHNQEFFLKPEVALPWLGPASPHLFPSGTRNLTNKSKNFAEFEFFQPRVEVKTTKKTPKTTFLTIGDFFYPFSNFFGFSGLAQIISEDPGGVPHFASLASGCLRNRKISFSEDWPQIFTACL